MSISAFSRFVRQTARRYRLAVQPRMGWGDPLVMRAALEHVKAQSPSAIGTLTLDSYTRVGDYCTPLLCLRNGYDLNGYPLLSHSIATTRTLLHGLHDEQFPVQVRHGTPEPQAIFRRMVAIGLDAAEGGPISYCLPYGRTSLGTAIAAWRESCEIFANEIEGGHIESFGGCMMGQLCPPAMLLAIGLLECMFFRRYGVRSVSLSYAQGTSPVQDLAALAVLRELAAQYLSDADWHVVVYTYMGLFPETDAGAARLIADSARLAVDGRCERLIVKTRAERRCIPPLEHNLHAIELAASVAASARACRMLAPDVHACRDELAEDVRTLVDRVLNLDADLSQALLTAFGRGLLDVPYCLHPDNRGSTRAAIDENGFLRWTRRGQLALREVRTDLDAHFSSAALLAQLSYVARSYDARESSAASGESSRTVDEHAQLNLRPGV